jgi:hypothetical protein
MLAPAAGDSWMRQPAMSYSSISRSTGQFPEPAGQTGARRTAPPSPTYSEAARNPIR